MASRVTLFGGAGFIADTLAIVLAPMYASGYLLVPMGVAGLPFMVWLLVKGVDVSKWRAKAVALDGAGYTHAL